MRPRATIFDSRSEQELFHAISGTWEPAYRVYPHMPFTSLIELDEHRLSAAELGFLHKTTVDYALTNAVGQPLLAIEFDGLGHGAWRKGGYVQHVFTKRDPNRAWKLDLKGRVANGAGLPFCIVSYEEKEVVDAEVNLVIAHGIVGGYLAQGYASRLMQELYEEDREYIESLPRDEQYDYVSDHIVISAEIEAEMALNPIAKRAAEVSAECFSLAPIGGKSEWWPEDGEPPRAADPENPDWDVDARIMWLDSRPRVGAAVAVETGYGRVERVAWVRNIDYPGMTALSLAGDIAELLAWKEALALIKRAVVEGRPLQALPTIEIKKSTR